MHIVLIENFGPNAIMHKQRRAIDAAVVRFLIVLILFFSRNAFSVEMKIPATLQAMHPSWQLVQIVPGDLNQDGAEDYVVHCSG